MAQEVYREIISLKSQTRKVLSKTSFFTLVGKCKLINCLLEDHVPPAYSFLSLSNNFPVKSYNPFIKQGNRSARFPTAVTHTVIVQLFSRAVV